MVIEILLYTFVSVILVTIAIIYFKIIRSQKRLYDAFRAQGVNGEPFIPLIGQLLELRRYRGADSFMQFQDDLARKHGNIYLFGLGPTVRLVIADPDLLASVFSKNNAQNYIRTPFMTRIFTSIIGHQNLLVIEGEEHKRARRMINPIFHQINLKATISVITDRTAKVIKSFFTASDSNQETDKSIDLYILIHRLIVSIVASSAFGSDLETNINVKYIISRAQSELYEVAQYRAVRIIDQIPLLSKLPFWKKDIFDNHIRTIAEFINQAIADRRQGHSTSMSNGPDFLDSLLSAVDDHGKSFTDQQIKEHAYTLFISGSRTTASLVAWACYILMTHEDVLQACREEVDRILPNGIEPTDEHLSELVVCDAILNETLRLYPPGPFIPLYCIREHMIGTEHKLRIPVGTTLTVNTYHLHRRSDIWPRPLEFDYTRWLRNPKTGIKPKLPHPFAYLPFGTGTHNCVAQNFGLLEAKILLAMFVQRCNFEIKPGQTIVPEFKAALKPKYGLWAKVSQR